MHKGTRTRYYPLTLREHAKWTVRQDKPSNSRLDAQQQADAPFSSIVLNKGCGQDVASRTSETPYMSYYNLAPPRPHCGV
jgi:hypothetical protein